jgi:hypothetical protein
VLVNEHLVPVQRACRVVRLSRAAYYRPPVSASRRDAAVIAALTDVVARYGRWGFWKCFDRLRVEGHRWNHKRVHRVTTRAAGLNTIRGLLREFGIFIPVGASRVVPQTRERLAAPTSRLPEALCSPLAPCDEIDTLEDHIRTIERQLADVAHHMDTVPLLQTIPGVGLRTPTALVALVGDIHRFPSGRHLASFLGLTPMNIQCVSAPPRRDQQGTGRLLAHLARAGRTLRAVARSRGRTAHRLPTLGAEYAAATGP